MARPLRIQVADGWYHVTSRGNGGEIIFRRDKDRGRFLGLLAELPELFGTEIHAFAAAVRRIRNPAPLTLKVAGPTVPLQRSSLLRVKRSGSAARMKGRAIAPRKSVTTAGEAPESFASGDD